MTKYRVERLIRGFDRKEELVSEHPIPESWTLERLQALFGIPPENPMYDVYPIEEEHRQLLRDAVGEDISPDVEYFVYADAVD